jgi:hypothetical protein
MAIKISGTTIIDDSRVVNDAKLQAYKEKIVSVGTVTTNTNLDLSLGNLFDVTLGGSVTFTFTNPPRSPNRPRSFFVRMERVTEPLLLLGRCTPTVNSHSFRPARTT